MKTYLNNLQSGNKVTQGVTFVVIATIVAITLLIVNFFHPGLFNSRYLN